MCEKSRRNPSRRVRLSLIFWPPKHLCDVQLEINVSGHQRIFLFRGPSCRKAMIRTPENKYVGTQLLALATFRI